MERKRPRVQTSRSKGIRTSVGRFSSASEPILKSKRKNVRRGRGKSKNKNDKHLFFIGNNCAGLRNKLDSLMSVKNKFSPVGVIFLQETKLYKKGFVKIPDFTIFENLRENNGGGGLLTAVHNSLNPVLVNDDDVYLDLMTVCAEIDKQKIYLINGYGKQEDDEFEERMEFFMKLEMAMEEANNKGLHFCAHIDGNAKIGKEVLTWDKHNMSENGRILLEIVERQDTVIVNSSSKCIGLITRQRKTVVGDEKSIIDYFIVSQAFYEMVERMKIDEEGIYVLSSYKNEKNSKTCKVTESDHNIMTLKMKNILKNRKTRIVRKEFYNQKNEDGQKKFHEMTSNMSKLRKILMQNDSDFLTRSTRWMKEIQNIIKRCFKKVRITNSEDPIMKSLFQNLLSLKEKYEMSKENESEEIMADIKRMEEKISQINSERNSKKILQHFETLNGEDGESFTQLNMWKLKKQVCKSISNPPVAKYDPQGNLITGGQQLLKLYGDTYKERLRWRELTPDYAHLGSLKSGLFKLRLETSKLKKSEKWSSFDLGKVSKSLKEKMQ